jgi:ABC-type multidrug transport system permease subunit
MVAALLAAAGLSAYLVHRFAWRGIKAMKILASAAGLVGFLVLFSLFFPGGLLFLVHWLPGILFMLGSILLAGVFIRLRYPLACGPRYG